MTIFIEKCQTSVLAIRVILTMNPIVFTGALYLLSVQIVVEIIGSPAVNLRSNNSRISVTAYYRITFGIKISSETLSELLGISLSSCYELMHEKGFPVIRIGKRMVVEKSRFIEWVKNNTAGDRKC